MRHIKRSASLLLALLLIFALLPLSEAQTGTLQKNSGTRHELCTALSAQAQAYYTGSYTFETVSALTASASDPMNSPMFKRLHDLMKNTMENSVTYNNLTDYWPKTDANNGSNDPMLFYSDATASGYNREHVWPNSHGTFNESGGGSDLHHLRPENSDINSARGSYTFGNVKNVSAYSGYQTHSYGGQTVLWVHSSKNRVEVKDDVKGDVARILLYVWCRWEEPNLYQDTGSASGTDGVKVIESLDTLLQWMENDPVDTWEMSRNDQCENVQGNRNVFIDYPEYAWLLFNRSVPENYQTPTGSGNGSGGDNPGGGEGGSKTYTLVTQTPSDWSGEYLIVYQNGSLAFDSSLSTLDAADNGAAITISGNQIVLNDTQNYAFTFTQTVGGYSILSSGGKYIGRTSASNGIDVSEETAYVNTISLNGTSVEIKGSGGIILQFNNASGQNRFRYFKTSQQPVSLYKLQPSEVYYTVTFAPNGGSGSMAAQTVAAGGSCTLPQCTFTAPQGKQFAGWTVGTDTTLRQPGDTVANISSNITVTAQWEDQAPATNAENLYLKLREAPKNASAAVDWTGNYLIVYEAGNIAFDSSRSDLTSANCSVPVTINNGIIEADSKYAFSFAKSGNTENYTIKSDSGKYIGQTGSNNGLVADANTANTSSLTYVGTSTAHVDIQATSGATHLRYNPTANYFRYYKNTSYTDQKPVALYRQAPGFMTQSLTLDNGMIGVNFYVDLAALTEAELNANDVYMTFAIDGSGAREDSDAFDPNCKNPSGQYYGFTFFVTSIQMANTITATLHYKANGVACMTSKEYHITDYFTGFDAILTENPSAFSEEMQNLVKALANYGNHVQHFLEAERSWSYANGDYAEMTKFYENVGETPEALLATVNDENDTTLPKFQKTGSDSFPATGITYSLALDSATAINVYIKPVSGYTLDEANLPTLTVTYRDGETDVDVTNATISVSGNRLRVLIPNIKAQELNRSFEITLSEDGTTLATATVSALCYVRSMLLESQKAGSWTHGATQTQWQNAAAAIYNYFFFADEYVR